MLFTARTANAIISRHRNQQNPAQALADYDALIALGIQYASCENQAALAAYELAKFDRALAHVQQAIVLDPSEAIFKANLGYIQFIAGKPLLAHQTFARLRTEHASYQLGEIYLSPEALAAYAAYMSNPNSVLPSAVRKLLTAALPLAETGKTTGRDKISKALADLPESDPPPVDPKEPEPISGLQDLWAKLLEAIGRASPFARSYFIEAHPVSFENGVFVVGFSTEFHDHLAMIDNSKNHSLIATKLRDLGYQVSTIQIVKT